MSRRRDRLAQVHVDVRIGDVVVIGVDKNTHVIQR